MTGTVDKLELAWAEVDPQAIADPTLAAVKAYWDGKRDTRTMPARADINPVDLRQHLGWIMMVEVLPDYSDFRYKLIGTKVTRYFVTNSTGRTVSETFARFGPGAVKGVQAVYRKAAREQVPVRAFGEANWLVDWKADGRGFPNFDSLYLPLSDDGKRANMLICVFTFDYARVMEQSESVLG